MKHLGLIRKSFNVPSSTPDSSPPQAAPPPRARRPEPDPNASPPPYRLARPPEIPALMEEDENDFSSPESPRGSADAYNPVSSPTPARRKKSRASSSSSSRQQSAGSSRATSPPPALDLQMTNLSDQLNKAGKRKPTRRQSGLLTTSMSITTVTPKGYSTEVIPPRPVSPALGSPLRMEAVLQEEAEVLAVVNGRNIVDDDDEREEPLAVTVTRRDKKKSKEKDRDYEEDRDVVVESNRKERKKRSSHDVVEDPGSPLAGKKPKLKDVTNAPPPRPSLTSTLGEFHFLTLR